VTFPSPHPHPWRTARTGRREERKEVFSKTTTRPKPRHGPELLHGTLASRSGLRIGGSDGELAIGGLDATVIRDPLTRQPYIPGSSLKGKLRSLLERFSDKEFNHNGGTTNNPIWRHECAPTRLPGVPPLRRFIAEP
jgi:CRISPR/Cas system CMR subunit Cmr6 (Cas7 group RAMP superfamily)